MSDSQVLTLVLKVKNLLYKGATLSVDYAKFLISVFLNIRRSKSNKTPIQYVLPGKKLAKEKEVNQCY